MPHYGSEALFESDEAGTASKLYRCHRLLAETRQDIQQTTHTIVPPPPLHEKITISPDFEAVVMKALSKDPKERFANIQAFATALEQAYQGNVSTFVKPLPPVVPSSHPIASVLVEKPPHETAPP